MTFEAMIDAMSPEERFAAMQILWDKITELPETIEPPEWHGEILAERIAKFERGESKLVDWTDAKKRLQERFR